MSPTESPMPMTLSEAAVVLVALDARGVLTDRERRAIEVALRTARRVRSSSTSQVNMVADLIAARDAQKRALEALDRAIGTATTATEIPAQG